MTKHVETEFVTPILEMEGFINGISLYVKHEGFNITGSIKDRAAKNVIYNITNQGILKKNGVVIESSSGNMGIALNWYCNKNNLEFYCVIDPNINDENRRILEILGANIILVDEMDRNGGYLLSRLNRINDFICENKNAYWVNQYNNNFVVESYYNIADEMCEQIGKIDYLFMAVSSGGSIAGVSRRIKKIQPSVKVICVDVEGSVIFGKKPKKRYIPGAGASIVPKNLEHACIDEVIWVEEIEAIKMCHMHMNTQFLLGGSSGLVLAGIKQYFERNVADDNTKVATIFPDRGERYIKTIYNQEWVEEKFKI